MSLSALSVSKGQFPRRWDGLSLCGFDINYVVRMVILSNEQKDILLRNFEIFEIFFIDKGKVIG
jgi:hypothetical protein